MFSRLLPNTVINALYLLLVSIGHGFPLPQQRGESFRNRLLGFGEERARPFEGIAHHIFHLRLRVAQEVAARMIEFSGKNAEISRALSRSWLSVCSTAFSE